MSFYGLNRAAINAGVASFVAGAALLAASSTVEASGTRVVLPEASVTLNSNVVVTGVRNCLGSAGFVTEVTGSAFPALLQLQFADIHITSGLKATYTNAWAHQTSVFEADGITATGPAITGAVYTSMSWSRRYWRMCVSVAPAARPDSQASVGVV